MPPSSLPAVWDGADVPRAARSRCVAVTFRVPRAFASHAELVAEFTSWTPLAMDLRSDGDHVITVLLPPGGRWRYRFLLEGSALVNDLDADEFEATTDGALVSVVRS